jgi:DNA mismatch repair protein MutS
LTELSQTLKWVKNYNIAVKKRGDNITFLRRIVSGSADRSYGIEVAALAGVPKEVVTRAKEILAELEQGSTEEKPSVIVPQLEEQQLSFASSSINPVIQKLKETDMNTLTPIEALNLLFELTNQAKSM